MSMPTVAVLKRAGAVHLDLKQNAVASLSSSTGTIHQTYNALVYTRL